MSLLNPRSTLNYLKEHARPVDLALFHFLFEGEGAETVVQELKEFQNEDGGFGRAIEPDMRLPESSVLGTWMAFQTLKQLNLSAEHPMIQSALAYFVKTYEPEKLGWSIVPPEVDEHPHAPWWNYKEAMAHFGWGNPGAEILGLFLHYDFAPELHEPLKAKALERLAQVKPEDFHEVLCFKALYELADEGFRLHLEKPLMDLVKRAGSTHPEDWLNYAATPLHFVDSPESPFAPLFEADLFQENLAFLRHQMLDGNHWEPNWSWMGAYDEVWPEAKHEWSSHLTVKNLRLLLAFPFL